MKRFRDLFDPFSKNQPPLGFLDDLKKPYHTERPYGFNERCVEEGELQFNCLNIIADFPDPEGLLDTAYADLRLFMRISDIAESENGIPLRTLLTDIGCREAYKITVSEDGITVESGDTEGIRRALIYIEDEMLRREGAFLPIGVIERRPFIRSRISGGVPA
jgi:hypothetical protein